MKAGGVKLAVGIRKESGKVTLLHMQDDVKKGFLNVCGDAILVGVKTEND